MRTRHGVVGTKVQLCCSNELAQTYSTLQSGMDQVFAYQGHDHKSYRIDHCLHPQNLMALFILCAICSYYRIVRTDPSLFPRILDCLQAKA